jgi:hypothetical protein
MVSRFGRPFEFVAVAGRSACIIPLTFTVIHCNGWAADMMQPLVGDATGNVQDRNQRCGSGCGWALRICFAGGHTPRHTGASRSSHALSLSGKLDDRDGSLCRAGYRDLRAAVTYKEVI